MNEYVLSVNKFNRPDIKKETDAIYVLLVRLLLLPPNSSQTHPDMGVGLVERYRYISMEDLGELKTEISKQIAKFLPSLNAVTVEVEQASSRDIKISIEVNGTLYNYETDFEKQIIRLSDLN